MTDSFTGRAALVTGASRGIGRAIAAGLAAGGARVALLVRSEDELAGTAGIIKAAGGTAYVVPADLGDEGELSRAIERVRGELGPVDILVNNAGVVWPLRPTPTLDVADYAAATRINLLAPVTLAVAFTPGMVERGWGRVVNVSTGAVTRPASMIGGNAYVTTKAALEMHTINLALELDGTGVTVNVYRPGVVDTAMPAYIRAQDPARIGAALHERFVRTHAEGRLITPEQSAKKLLDHLANDDGTAQVWDADAA
ncbi:SDR family NAD(P)-dependent oxidoreductase [Nonomuraea fastidiosa]|uniref:SDR family NAD(P)-dependent oxidoreductase n=1 Tax=Nonomuraea fastidiosa TaxID=46173 RepID=UPI00366BC712